MTVRRTAYRAIRPLLFAVDPEAIHRWTLRALAVAGRNPPGRAVCRLAAGLAEADVARTPVDVLGLRFRNRVGLGAGFDKDGVALAGWAALGLGFAELGTVTPLPQAGNPRPRLFRLANDEALVNRMGFNNAGAAALAARASAIRARLPDGFLVGVNIGPNRDTPDGSLAGDFAHAAMAVAGIADYLTINVSSPNMPGLRGLQQPQRLREVLEAAEAAAPGRPRFVKLAPDLEPATFEALVLALSESPGGGVVLSNTTVGRGALRSRAALVAQAGGLSGRPLLEPMLTAVERARRLAGPGLAIVASGGIYSTDDARRAIDAGADLVQLWTGLVYAGPGLIGDVVRGTS